MVFPVWRIILPFSIRRKIDQGPAELIPALLIWEEEMSILAKAFFTLRWPSKGYRIYRTMAVYIAFPLHMRYLHFSKLVSRIKTLTEKSNVGVSEPLSKYPCRMSAISFSFAKRSLNASFLAVKVSSFSERANYGSFTSQVGKFTVDTIGTKYTGETL